MGILVMINEKLFLMNLSTKKIIASGLSSLKIPVEATLSFNIRVD